jgi:hypothetical protein
MSAIQFQEGGINPSGFLRIVKVFDDGSTSTVFQDQNLIVKSGKYALINQLYYSSGAGDPLSYAKIGTGGASDAEGLFLKIPTIDRTDLYNPVFSSPIVKTGDNPDIPTITLMANIDNSVGNGLKLNEAGFFTATGRMFNIKVFPTVLKKSSFSLNLEWVIKI